MGFTTTNTIFNHPTIQRLWKLQDDLKNTPWYHFMERIYIKDEINELKAEALAIGFNIAIQDLEEAGILTRTPSLNN